MDTGRASRPSHVTGTAPSLDSPARLPPLGRARESSAGGRAGRDGRAARRAYRPLFQMRPKTHPVSWISCVFSDASGWNFPLTQDDYLRA